ncbi:MAG: carboxypeptidase regulatory-like domain-containing protein [Myxococcota bacterium]
MWLEGGRNSRSAQLVCLTIALACRRTPDSPAPPQAHAGLAAAGTIATGRADLPAAAQRELAPVLASASLFAIGVAIKADGSATPALAGLRVAAVDSERRVRALCTSDAAGRCRLERLPRGKYELSVWGTQRLAVHEGSALQVGAADADEHAVTVALGANVSGRVETGAGTEVRLTPLMSEWDRALAPLVTHTNERGEFAWKQVPPGTYSLEALTSDGRVGLLSLEVAHSDESGLSLPLHRAARARGKIVDADGRAVAALRVEANATQIGSNKAASVRRVGSTNSSGDFELSGLEPGDYQLTLRDEFGSRPMLGERGALIGERSFSVTTSPIAELATLRTPTCRETLRVATTDANGSPAAHARVQVERVAATPGAVSAPLGDGRDVISADDGSLQLSAMCGGVYVLRAQSSDGRTSAVLQASPAAGVTRIALRPPSTFAAKVTFQGKPVRDFELWLTGAATVRRRFVEPTGAFGIELDAGPYEALLSAEHGYWHSAFLTGNSPFLPIDIELQPWSSLRGRVLDASGSPSAGARVVLTTIADNPNSPFLASEARTDARGDFELTRVLAGPARLAVFRKARALMLANQTYRGHTGSLTGANQWSSVLLRSGETTDVGVLRISP